MVTEAHKAKHQLGTPTVLGLPIFRCQWNEKFPILSVQKITKMIIEPHCACGTKKSITESSNIGFTCPVVSTESEISNFTIMKNQKKEFP